MDYHSDHNYLILSFRNHHQKLITVTVPGVSGEAVISLVSVTNILCSLVGFRWMVFSNVPLYNRKKEKVKRLTY